MAVRDNEALPLRAPTLRGVIARRILANFRIDPSALRGFLPAPFTPKLVDGYAIGGVCLIRLEAVRPRLLPAGVGLASENAAHRFAVQWKDGDTTKEGVFIPRRDSSSRFNTLVGGRIFPGVHHLARFEVADTGENLSVSVRSLDDGNRVAVAGRVASSLPSRSVFPSVAAASEFFRRGAVGYSISRNPGFLEGLELRTDAWSVMALDALHVESTLFGASGLFPRGATEFDCALLMRQVPHEWRSLPPLAVQTG
jgi:hypothetical protein